MSKPLEVLREALYASGLVQPLDSTGRGGSVSVLCREVPGQMKGWLSVVDELLASPGAEKVDLHVCRRYVRKNGQMVFGWFVGINAKNVKDLNEALELFAPIITNGRTRFAQNIVLLKPSKATSSEEAEEQAPRPPVSAFKKGFNLAEQTDARPRAPEYHGPDPKIPNGYSFKSRRFVEGDKEITEMPLPHVYSREINRPVSGSKRGAALLGKNTELLPNGRG